MWDLGCDKFFHNAYLPFQVFHVLARSLIANPFFFYRYVDVILQLIDKAGDFVSDDIWYRVVQFVTNNEDLQVSNQVVININSFLI